MIRPVSEGRWFEIHDRRLFKIDSNKEIGFGLTRDGKPHLEALAKMTCPIYMTEEHKDIPTSVRYPIEKMAELYGDYFTNSISYMICLAIYEEYKEIGIWGVDMATYTEYATQRASCEYYIGVAHGKGIKVFIPPQADLLKTKFRYGFEFEKEDLFNSKLDNLYNGMNGRLQFSGQNHDRCQKEIDQYIGGLEIIKEIRKIWSTLSHGAVPGLSTAPVSIIQPIDSMKNESIITHAPATELLFTAPSSVITPNSPSGPFVEGEKKEVTSD